MLKELLDTLSKEEIVKLMEAIYYEGKADGWIENSIDNGYEGHCRDDFSELAREIVENPTEFLNSQY